MLEELPFSLKMLTFNFKLESTLEIATGFLGYKQRIVLNGGFAIQIQDFLQMWLG